MARQGTGRRKDGVSEWGGRSASELSSKSGFSARHILKAADDEKSNRPISTKYLMQIDETERREG